MLGVVACISPCARYHTNRDCCRGLYAGGCTPATTWPIDYADVFKWAEPYAYSWSGDDATSVFTCSGGCDYRIIFGVTPPGVGGPPVHGVSGAGGRARVAEAAAVRRLSGGTLGGAAEAGVRRSVGRPVTARAGCWPCHETPGYARCRFVTEEGRGQRRPTPSRDAGIVTVPRVLS